MIFHGEVWDAYAREHPEKARALQEYFKRGGTYAEVCFIPEYNDFLRFEKEYGRR